MSEPRRPVRPLPAPGAPPPGAPAILWTRRGADVGRGSPAEGGPWDERIGATFLFFWRLLGALALPFLLLDPRTRRHIWGLPSPVPGWTWLHGASAGEHVAARALAPLIEPGAWRTSLSLRTPVKGAFPAPLDLPWVFERWLDRARPGRLVLIESELWPGWLAACRARSIPVVVVNARPSRGTARWRRIPPLWRWLSRDLRFVSQEETGDLKLAAELQEATFALGRDAFVAASTREGDERLLLAAWALVPDPIGRVPKPLLVLAPRHLDRVPAVVALLEQSGLRWSRRTEGVDPGRAVLLLDTLGELGGLFAQARAAYIGGTFDPALGGHSPAEAFRAGIPVVHGPETAANPNAWTQGIAVRVERPEPERLARAIRSAISVGPQAVGQNESAIRAAGRLPAPVTPPEAPPRPLLRPLVPAYQALARRGRGWSGAPERAGLPVVSVGALVAGGVGKTPVTGWLAEQLEGAWVVGRGYRRPGGGDDVRVGLPGAAPARPLGDELEMLRRRGLRVVSAPDRVAGAEAARRLGARLILLDDGFQHRRLHRDHDLVCLDPLSPTGGGPIPMGAGREGLDALLRAHSLWLHGPGEAPAGLPALPTVRSTLRPAGWWFEGALHPLGAVKGEIDVAVGVARPERFLCALLSLGLTLRSCRVVGDHRPLGELPAGCVVTEKDAARLPPGAPVRVLRMELVVKGAEPLLTTLRALIP